MQMSNVNAKQATRVHLFHSHSHSHSLPTPCLLAFATVWTCIFDSCNLLSLPVLIHTSPTRLQRCYHYLLAAHKQLALLAIGMRHAKSFLTFFFRILSFPSPSHPHPIPIPIAVAALRLADCMRLHFRKFGIRCEQRTQVSNI